MLSVKSASGTTAVANKDIWADCRATISSYTGRDDNYYPFRIKQLDLKCNADVSVKINGESVSLDVDAVKDGWYSIGIPRGAVLINSIIIVTSGTQWEATFLF